MTKAEMTKFEEGLRYKLGVEKAEAEAKEAYYNSEAAKIDHLKRCIIVSTAVIVGGFLGILAGVSYIRRENKKLEANIEIAKARRTFI